MVHWAPQVLFSLRDVREEKMKKEEEEEEEEGGRGGREEELLKQPIGALEVVRGPQQLSKTTKQIATPKH